MGFLDRLTTKPPKGERATDAGGAPERRAAPERPLSRKPEITSDTVATLTGGMGEPYCSRACYDRGGAAITEDLLTGWEGPCSVCRRILHLGLTSRASAVCDGPGLMLRFHQTDLCDAAVRERMIGRAECVVCGAPAARVRRVLTGLRTGHDAAVGALLALPDGRLVSGAADGSVVLWDLIERSAPLVLADHGAAVWTLAALADGRVVAAGFDGVVRAHAPDGAAAPEVLGSHKAPVQHCVVLPDGRLATGSQDGTVRVWRTDSRAPADPLVLKPDSRHRVEMMGDRPPSDRWVSSLVVLTTGLLMWSNGNRAVWAWDPRHDEGKPVSFARSDVGGEPLVVLPDGGVAACGFVSNPVHRVVRVWRPGSSTTPREMAFPVDHLIGHKLCGLPDGLLVLAGTSVTGLPPKDTVLAVLDPTGTSEPAVLGFPTGFWSKLVALDDGRVAIGTWDNSVLVCELRGGTQPLTLTGPSEQLMSVALLARQPHQRIAGGSFDGTITVWDVPAVPASSAAA